MMQTQLSEKYTQAPESLLLTPEEVSKVLKITLRATYELLKRNEIIAFKVLRKWRIPKASIDNFFSEKVHQSNVDNLLPRSFRKDNVL